MAEVIKMPRLSDTMEEGVVSQWLKFNMTEFDFFGCALFRLKFTANFKN